MANRLANRMDVSGFNQLLFNQLQFQTLAPTFQLILRILPRSLFACHYKIKMPVFKMVATGTYQLLFHQLQSQTLALTLQLILRTLRRSLFA